MKENNNFTTTEFLARRSKMSLALVICLFSGLVTSTSHAFIFSSAHDRMSRLMKLSKVPEVSIVASKMSQKFGRTAIEVPSLSSEMAHGLSPWIDAERGHSQVVNATKERRARMMQDRVPRRGQSQEKIDDFISHDWSGVQEVSELGVPVSVTVESEEDFKRFLTRVLPEARDGYKWDPKTGRVLFDKNLPLNYHPDVSMAEVSAEALGWELIHLQLITEKTISPTFVHNAGRVLDEHINFERLRRIDELESLRSELISEIKRVHTLHGPKSNKLPDLGEWLESTDAKLTNLKESTSGFMRSVDLIIDLVAEYSALTMVEKRVQGVVKELNGMKEALLQKKADGLVKRVPVGADSDKGKGLLKGN